MTDRPRMAGEQRLPLVGLSNNGQALAGHDALLSVNAAVTQLISNWAREASILTSQMRQMGFVPEGTPVGSAYEGQRVMFDTVQRTDPSSQNIEGTRVPSDRTVAPPAQDPEPARVPSDRAGGEPRPPAQSSYDLYQERRDFFKGDRGFSLRNLRQRAGEAAQRRMGNWEWGEQLTWDEGTGGWLDESGGQVLEMDRISSFMNREKMMGAGREFARSLSQGQTLRQAGMGALPGGLAKAAGWVGATAFAVDAAGDFFEGQRSANAEWQSMLGGTQMDAMGQRLEERMFTMGQFGFMGDEQAREAFQGVSRTGMRGDERANALAFISQNYGQLGMSVADSLELVKTAAETGQESLAGVASSLTRVSESAREAGVNAEVAREMFTRSWGSFSGLFGGGPMAAQLATATTEASIDLGRELAGAGINLSDTNFLRRIGMTQFGGSDLNAVVAMANSGAEGQRQLLAGAEAQMQADFPLLFNGSGYQNARQLIAQAQQASGGQLTDSEIERIVNTLLGDRNNGFKDLIALNNILPRLGLQGGDNAYSSLKFVIRSMAGEYSLTANFDEAQAEMQSGRLTGGSQMYMGAGEMGDTYYTTANSPEMQAEMERVRQSDTRAGWKRALGIGDDHSRIIQGYEQGMQDTGLYAGIAGRLAGDRGAASEVEMLEITDESGKSRIVTLAEALEYYLPQVQSGELNIVQGAAAGQTLAEYMGGYGDTSQTGTVSEFEEDAPGMSREEFEAQQDVAQRRGEDVGTVVLSLTPEARRLLNVSTTGNVYMQDDWATPEQHRNPSAGPSGNP